MAKPTVHVTVKTEKYGHVVIVTPAKGKFDDRFVTELVDSDWYDELRNMSGVHRDVSFSTTELRIGRSRKNKDAFFKAILPKIQEKFAVENHKE